MTDHSAKAQEAPVFSILMPAYNAALYIEESILSVQQQTFENWELLVVDDGSTDETATIVQRIQLLDPRVHYIFQSNKKQAAARNTGIRASRGEWLAFLDSDDRWTKDKLSKQWEAILERKPDVIYSAGYYYYQESGSTEPYDTLLGAMKGIDNFLSLYGANHIPILSVAVKRSVVDEIGLQDENVLMHGCEDWDHLLRMAKRNFTFWGMEDRLFYYRKHSLGTSADGSKMQLAQSLVLCKNFDPHFITPSYFVRELKPLFDSIALILLTKGKTKEIRYLYEELKKTYFKRWFGFQLFLLRLFGSQSALPFRVLNKVFRALHTQVAAT